MTTLTTTRRRYYNNTGDSYESSRYADAHMDGYRDFRNQTLLSILQDNFGSTNLRILEVGCGTGLTLQFLSRTSRDYSLFGIDLSDTMLQQAADKADALENAPKLSIGDADRLPYADKQFDVVFATRFIHQFSHAAKQQLWREFKRVTRSNGLIVLEFYARPYHHLRYYLGGKKGRSAEAYFSHYPTRKEVREIVNGPPQIYPLRLPGARVIASALGENLLRRATTAIGHASGGLLIDEYFVAARNR
jgi:ubiquinone/menaquinone biosynthesis C-methylase UbiE